MDQLEQTPTEILTVAAALRVGVWIFSLDLPFSNDFLNVLKLGQLLFQRLTLEVSFAFFCIFAILLMLALFPWRFASENCSSSKSRDTFNKSLKDLHLLESIFLLHKVENRS